ncbi:MAG: DMT family transporter [Anaerolineales bacterium]|nr:DMT family transporter [Anaerolineales bacterium]
MSSTLQKASQLTGFNRGYLICIIATVLWSSTAVFIRYLTVNYQMPPLVLAFWRDLFLTLVLGVVFAIMNPIRLVLKTQDRKFMLFYGFVLAIFNSTWTVSVALNGAAVSTVLAYSSAAFTAILGWWLLGESLGAVKIVAVTLSFLGCIFVSGAYDPSTWQLNPVGIITGLASGIFFASYSLMGKAASDRSINPWTTLLYAFAGAAVFIFLFNLFGRILPSGVASTDFFWLGGNIVGWLVLFTLAIGPTIGGYGLYTVSLTYLPASVANIIATLEPVMTAALAYVLLAERFTLPQILGSVLIISSVIILRFSQDRLPAP